MTFGDHLRREASFVLEDAIFQRSPTQAKLLRYLVKRALAGGPAPSQHEIAVDGLDRPENFDLANDSYPRVQVSRLRTNLDNYYARTQPHDGYRLKIEQGQYEIALVPYQPPSAPVPTPADAHPATSGENRVGESSAEPFDMTGALPASADGDGSTDGTDGPAAKAERKRGRGRAFIIAPIALIGLVIAGLLAWRTPGPGENLPPQDLEKPSIVLRTDLTGLDGNGDADRDAAELAVRLAEILLTYSLVSNIQPESGNEAADYILNISFVQEPGKALQTFVRSSDANGETVFNEIIEHAPARPERFAEEIRSALTYITSPTGKIAKDRRDAFGNSLASGFACFITIENRRAEGGEVADMVEECIERHPQGEYAPFFRARRAFAAFDTARREGKAIRASGPAWRDLQLALKADPFNPFAQFVASRVLLAQGNCQAAQSSMRIASQHLSTYPRLRAAIDAESAGCPGWDEEIGLSDEELQAMVATSPAPEPLHHFYMLVAAIASDDLDSARLLMARPQQPASPEGEMKTIAMLHRALDDPAYAQRNAERLHAAIALKIWGERSVDRVIANLTREAEASQDEPGRSAVYSTGTAPTSLASRP